MIKEKGGRARSIRTPEETSDSLREEIERLSPDERKTLRALLVDMQTDQRRMLKFLAEQEYKTPPVDMRTFIKDDRYLGRTCDNLYPRLLDDLVELFEGGYHECIFTGAIGYGKTFAAAIGVCRVLYEISCLKDPHKTFGLAKDTNISVVCLSVNETLATKVVFENISIKVKASPYFQDEFRFEATKKELRFPHNVWVAARATTDTSALGLNCISAFIDESNFMPTSRGRADERFGYVDHAETIYNAVNRRMKSRFSQRGKLPGMIFIVSSKKTADDFTARRVRESMNDSSVFVRDYALWEIKPEDYYSAKKFWVLVGNEQVPSRILDAEEAERVRPLLPESVVLLDVPEDFRPDFERDLEGSIRDLGGCATVAISPFIQRREKIVEAVDPKRSHPFTSLIYDPSKGGAFDWEQMVRMVKEKDFDGGGQRLRPLINPNAPRHVHIDPSLRGDSTGLVMAHVSGFVDVRRRKADGQEYLERAPTYVVDLLLKVVPPVGDEIVLGDVRRIVYDLSAHGYLVTCISMDSWQSADAIQQLQQRGFNAKLLSVDTSMDPYDNLKTALYEGRVSYYRYEPLIKELQQLEKDLKRKKVDHPPKGSKDLADALAGCLFTLSQQQTIQPVPILRGSSYYGDAWMVEQQEAFMAGQPLASGNQPLCDVPQILVGRGGSGGSGGWGDDGGGWL